MAPQRVFSIPRFLNIRYTGIMRIWKGSIKEAKKTFSIFPMSRYRFPYLQIAYPPIDETITIPTTEGNVIRTEFNRDLRKLLFANPSRKLSQYTCFGKERMDCANSKGDFNAVSTAI
jgi:hypothetical protein